MDYKKKYNEALERARANYKADKEMGFLENCDMLELIFPELRESEDERIRKTLVEYFGPKVQLDFVRGVPIQKIRDWLERQKPAMWSEEDEKDMAHIIRILDDCYAYGKHDLSKTDHENLVNKLKSLRPDIYKNCNSRRKPRED